MSAHNRSWQTSDFCISTKPISDRRYYLFGLISVPFDVQTVDVRYKGSVMLILYKDQTSLFLTPLRREVLHPKKDTQLQRHVEARRSCTVAQFGTRQIVNRKPAILDQFVNLFEAQGT